MECPIAILVDEMLFPITMEDTFVDPLKLECPIAIADESVELSPAE
jgi:hypothetical protein